MISTLIALPYELARLPVVIVDKNLSDRLPESSGPRVGLDRAIGAGRQARRHPAGQPCESHGAVRTGSSAPSSS